MSQDFLAKLKGDISSNLLAASKLKPGDLNAKAPGSISGSSSKTYKFTKGSLQIKEKPAVVVTAFSDVDNSNLQSSSSLTHSTLKQDSKDLTTNVVEQNNYVTPVSVNIAQDQEPIKESVTASHEDRGIVDIVDLNIKDSTTLSSTDESIEKLDNESQQIIFDSKENRADNISATDIANNDDVTSIEKHYSEQVEFKEQKEQIKQSFDSSAEVEEERLQEIGTTDFSTERNLQITQKEDTTNDLVDFDDLEEVDYREDIPEKEIMSFREIVSQNQKDNKSEIKDRQDYSQEVFIEQPQNKLNKIIISGNKVLLFKMLCYSFANSLSINEEALNSAPIKSVTKQKVTITASHLRKIGIELPSNNQRRHLMDEDDEDFFSDDEDEEEDDEIEFIDEETGQRFNASDFSFINPLAHKINERKSEEFELKKKVMQQRKTLDIYSDKEASVYQKAIEKFLAENKQLTDDNIQDKDFQELLDEIDSDND